MGTTALDGLNARQRAAAEAVTGPVCILAGAGSGKTRTITHRIAHQVATGAARPEQVLAVTFTDRAAGELRERLRRLGTPGPLRTATFHAAAYAQLRHFWSRVTGRPLPGIVSSKVPLLLPAARRLRVEARDLAAEVEWAKARRLSSDQYAAHALGRRPPVGAERMAAVFADYERDKDEANLIDFDDMILLTERMLREHEDVAAEVRGRYRFVTVDEYQDVNPAQDALLTAWLGDGDDLCVVGDDAQTIYGFAGASPDYLRGFRSRYPRATVVTLVDNYRSTPEVLQLANRLLGNAPGVSTKRLVAHNPPGPAPRLTGFDDDEVERDAVVAQVRELLADGLPAGRIAICYRVNSQSEALEEALSRAGLAYVVRGDRGFFDRPEILQALALLRARAAGGARSAPPEASAVPDGTSPATHPRADRLVETALREGLSWHPRREPDGDAARERWRNLSTLLGLATQTVRDDPSTTFAGVVDDLVARAAAGHESADPDGAVTLLTLHKAKGLEFDAVFIVAVEEGLVPISHATDDGAVAEERRLLYVGLTRARRHLWVSWARSRPGVRGTPVRRRPSRFLYGLGPGAPQRAAKTGGLRTPAQGASGAAVGGPGADTRLGGRLRAWRLERSRRDGVPAYVVFDDRTLTALAERRPGSTRELLEVRGFGPVKADRYGDELLAVLRSPGPRGLPATGDRGGE